MAQSKILVDTNAYLRLAKTIRPLLFVPFGENSYCLYILPELNKELQNHKFQNAFYWVNEDEYVENRKHFPAIGRKQKKVIEDTFEFVWDYVQTDLPGPSRVDALYVAYALELNVPVVTDDQDMTKLAIEFDAKVMSTLELLKVMLDCGHTDMKTIKGLCEYCASLGIGRLIWKRILVGFSPLNDTPNHRFNYRNLTDQCLPRKWLPKSVIDSGNHFLLRIPTDTVRSRKDRFAPYSCQLAMMTWPIDDQFLYIHLKSRHINPFEE